jgi:hypothetical protein
MPVQNQKTYTGNQYRFVRTILSFFMGEIEGCRYYKPRFVINPVF